MYISCRSNTIYARTQTNHNSCLIRSAHLKIGDGDARQGLNRKMELKH